MVLSETTDGEKEQEVSQDMYGLRTDRVCLRQASS